MEKRDKYLPIGSVVLLKGGTKKVMVTGFCSIAEEDKTRIYDYSGCIYPEGYLTSNQICLFDHNQIQEIFHIGYEDSEEREFKVTLEETLKEYQAGEFGLDDFDDEDDDDEIEFGDEEDLDYL